MVGRKGRGIWVPYYDGDGILDAEELAPPFCHVQSIIDLQFDIPPFSELDSSGNPIIYANKWPNEGGVPIYHNIDFVDSLGKTRCYKTLNPMDADSDEDGVPDGVEITDNTDTGRKDKLGNPLGLWPDEDGYTEADYTDPLDPTKFNPGERSSKGNAPAFISQVTLVNKNETSRIAQYYYSNRQSITFYTHQWYITR